MMKHSFLKIENPFVHEWTPVHPLALFHIWWNLKYDQKEKVLLNFSQKEWQKYVNTLFERGVLDTGLLEKITPLQMSVFENEVK